MSKIRTILVVLVYLVCFSQARAEIAMKWKEIYIPFPEAMPKGLETIIAWPDDDEKHPIALLTNGSPRDKKERANMRAISSLPIAREFVKRNFAVAWVLRRGYGTSGGGWAEDYGDCSLAAYHRAGLAGAEDLRAAIIYLGTLPQFDINRVLVVGYSAGGYATVALTANPPPQGIVAAISFAGGRGAKANDIVCGEDALVNNFETFGKSSIVPMLWIYAKNDHFFNPETAERFYQAFTGAGGKAEFIAADPYGKEGHFLFSNAGIPNWSPLIDDFLIKYQLENSNTMLTIADKKHLAPLPYMTEKEKNAFSNFVSAGPHKAFADNGKTRFGWRTAQRTIEEAKNSALENCQLDGKYQCHVIAVDDDMVTDNE